MTSWPSIILITLASKNAYSGLRIGDLRRGVAFR